VINFEIDLGALVSTVHNSVSVNVYQCSSKILVELKQSFLFM